MSKAEALRWQGLYEELRLRSGQLREQQQLGKEQLQQLHSQVEVQYTVATCALGFQACGAEECCVPPCSCPGSERPS